MRWWAFWRRVQYGTGFLVLISLFVFGVYRVYFYSPGNCFDTVANNGERGVDCGGSCVRICAADVTAPEILWAKSFEISKGQYNAVAYVENKNQLAATPVLEYTFEFYDGATKVGERKGQTILPPSSVYPIFEGRILTTEARITDTRLTLKPAELWVPASVGRGQFQTSRVELLSVDSQPRLNVTIENTELTVAKDIEVVATLFNTLGEPLTASQTFVDSLDGRTSRDIVFTWPNPLSKTIRSCEVPSDVVIGIDLSGSMNNDGGTPPQPVTDALLAAKQFAASLSKEDQASIVTFATNAQVVTQLSKNHTLTSGTIGNLSIRPADEQGFTNTAEALAVAAQELSSSRHNPNARRALILLTDGLPTAPGENTIEADTKEAASRLRDSGVLVYAIGLGSGVDKTFISGLASEPENAYLAPKASDLGSIYKTITSSLCESGTTRIEVIAKTGANFTPLR